MDDSTTPDPPQLGLFTRQEAERRQLIERHQARERGRILAAAQVDAASLSDRGRRVLDWLTGWDTPTVDGLVELLVAARLGVYVEWHRDELDRKVEAVAESDSRVEAALARYDERCARRQVAGSDGRGCVEL